MRDLWKFFGNDGVSLYNDGINFKRGGGSILANIRQSRLASNAVLLQTFVKIQYFVKTKIAGETRKTGENVHAVPEGLGALQPLVPRLEFPTVAFGEGERQMRDLWECYEFLSRTCLLPCYADLSDVFLEFARAILLRKPSAKNATDADRNARPYPPPQKSQTPPTS